MQPGENRPANWPFKTGTQIFLFTLAALSLFVVASTYGEFTSLRGDLAICRTSGCARSTGFGAIFLLFTFPVIVILFSLGFALLVRLGCFLAKQKVQIGNLLFLTLFPFVPTSLLFILFTNVIFEPGYQTDLRFFVFMLAKAMLLCINALLLILSARLICRSNWKKVVVISVFPLILLGILFAYHIKYASPHLHYLAEARTYQLAKYYLLDRRIRRIHCAIDVESCLEDYLTRKEVDRLNRELELFSDESH